MSALRGFTEIVKLAALATVIASLLPLGSRVAWIFELASHFRVQYVVVAVVLAIVLAVQRQPAWAAVLVACAALSAWPVLPYVGSPVQSARAAAGRPTIKVLSANVLYHNHETGRFLDILRRESPDVVLLDEFTPEWRAKLDEVRKAYPYHLEQPRLDAFGIALYSRFELESVRPFALGPTTAIEARLRTPAGDATVVGVHLRSPGSPRRAAVRNWQLRALADHVAAIPGPLIVMGDFNVTPYSPYYTDWLARTGLTDTRRGRTLSPSWPAFFPVLAIPIDHCAVSRDVTIIAHRGLPAFGSDHYPILAELALPVASGEHGKH
jgi:endonuclease/exonuclease/phosphatase (EEP) superfamily protein YafD